MKKGIIAAVITVAVAIVCVAIRVLGKGAGAVGNLFSAVKN